MLPTLILQPFVENAIWHGLSRKTSLGHIRIEFKKQENAMICTVEDNGLGRTESGKNKVDAHPSKAVQITEQRLQLIEKRNSPKTNLQIIDLYDEAGAPTGTKVEVRLPLDL